MTALALAGAGGGAVLPDLVLPAGFDRVGEVHRFEQDSGPEADRAGRVPGSLIASAIGAPAAAGQKPALSPGSSREAGRGGSTPHAGSNPAPGSDAVPTLDLIRRKGVRTLSLGRLTREERRHLAVYDDGDRPRTRGDCQDGPRPCPWVSCRWHLYLDVEPSGALHFTRPELEPWDLSETCALDVADAGGATLERTGELVNLTRERIRQIETRALERARRRNLHLEV